MGEFYCEDCNVGVDRAEADFIRDEGGEYHEDNPGCPHCGGDLREVGDE